MAARSGEAEEAAAASSAAESAEEARGLGPVSARDLAQAWQQSPTLRADLYSHLALHVPRVYCTAAAGCAHSEDFLAGQLLLEPLEWLLCGGWDPLERFGTLRQEAQTRQLCGHAFKMGEPTYSCRECAMDPTCVLCMECFQHSVHKSHRYRMNASGGGGLCDCGDVEAWKSGPFCDIHLPASGAPDPDPTSRLPSDLVARAQAVFSIALRYAADMLCWEEDDTLPLGLEPTRKGSAYYCMLFNDEVHTYEQVIYVLQKAVGCSQKEASNFATNIDRDGRKSVLYGEHKLCEQAKAVIERSTGRGNQKPLKVRVMLAAVVAHQLFAMRLLAWLAHVISHSEGLRRVLCQVGLDPGPDGQDSSPISRLMLYDSKLWKGARNVYHQLLMSSLLLDLEYKRRFAIQFTKNYQRLQKDFMEDDHERSVSVTALSVQIFTVPTLAQELIQTEGLVRVIVTAFVEQLLSRRDSSGRFQFERYTALQAFRFHRMHAILGDLRYVLACRPAGWSEHLRQRFLEGFDVLLELLRAMQGMDPVSRQVSQHMEVEPEWEAAFTLQTKLTHVLAMLQEWCASDELVLVEAYRRCVEALAAGQEEDGPETLVLAGHTVESGAFCVSQRPVSVHLPLSRLLAGLHVLLSRTEVAYTRPELLPLNELSPPALIEQPLRCLAMVAQVHAGMWRRNGFSLVNQIYYYHNVKCRREMFDKDILMLQVGASMMDPNHLLMILLKRFELFHLFLCPEYGRAHGTDAAKDMTQQNNSLLEEMLHLVIMITGERFVPGLGRVSPLEVTRREVVHQLCIKPMAHSELVRSLTEDENHETGMEAVIEEVATFRKPGVTSKGLYELKPGCARDFNLFYYHYTRAEQSKAEEAQGKLKKQSGEPLVFPPPAAPPLCALFASLVNVLQCDVLLLVLATALRWARDPRSHAWTEPMLQRALHLVVMALQEEKQQLDGGSGDASGSSFSVKAASPVSSGLEEHPDGLSLLALLRLLQNAAHLEAQKDTITWTLQLFEAVHQLHQKPSQGIAMAVPGQRAEENPQEREKAERKRKAELARVRREKVMAQMSAMQRNFIDENRELFEQTLGQAEVTPSPATTPSPVEGAHAVSGGGAAVAPCAVGPGAVAPPQGRRTAACILCQEEQEVSASRPAIVLAAYVQRSTVLSTAPRATHTSTDGLDPLLAPVELPCGIHTSSCGHAMHAHCWQSFFEAVQIKEQRRQHRLRAHASYDVDAGEFLCPLCQCISNTVLPVVPASPTTRAERTQPDSEEEVEVPVLAAWLGSVRARVAGLHALLHHHGRATDCHKVGLVGAAPGPPVLPDGFLDILRTGVQPQTAHSESLQAMLATFGTAVFRVGLRANPNEADPRMGPVAWGTVAFSIHAVERCLLEEGKPLFGSLPRRQDDCLRALTGFSAAQRTVLETSVRHSHVTQLFSYLLHDPQLADNSPAILDVDMFSLLVGLVLCAPALFASPEAGGPQQEPSGIASALADLHLLHLVTMATVAQLLLTAGADETDEPMDQQSNWDSEELRRVSTLHRQLLAASGVDEREPSPWHLVQRVRAGATPFLRCCALLFHYLRGTPAPPELHAACPTQFEVLCRYLSLPVNLAALFTTHEGVATELLHRWCGHGAVRAALRGERRVVQCLPELSRLVPIPEDYSELINRASRFTCPRLEGDESRAPIMCLVCGTMLCSQSYCCQSELDGEDVGACTAHTYTCGAGVGIFLRVRLCQVLLLSAKTKGCYYPPPYLDDYGETDVGLKRGNPLHLCPERYMRLQRLWQQHGVAEEIGHAQDANQSYTSIDWQQM
ncbi:E3 ubiquitin-protein ligase UBR2 isoform X2 [Lampetra planeri]